MKSRNVLWALTFLAALFALECASPSVVVLTNSGRIYSAVEPDSVHITTEIISSPLCTEIGYLFVQDDQLERVVKTSRKRAGDVGGHTIMNARIGVNVKQVGTFLSFPIYDQSYFVRGVVVRRRSSE